MYYSTPGFWMLLYCWDQIHRSILCTIGREHTGHHHLPSNLKIVSKLSVLWIRLVPLWVGPAHWTQSKIYTNKRMCAISSSVQRGKLFENRLLM